MLIRFAPLDSGGAAADFPRRGHRWRWKLLPQNDDASTYITEIFDYSTIDNLQARALELFGVPKQDTAGIEATLSKLQQQHA